MLDVGMRVNTTELLRQVQEALKLADLVKDQELHNCAESVLSALMRVARQDYALIPGVLRDRVEHIKKRLDSAA